MARSWGRTTASVPVLSLERPSITPAGGAVPVVSPFSSCSSAGATLQHALTAQGYLAVAAHSLA